MQTHRRPVARKRTDPKRLALAQVMFRPLREGR
jgi:hypothetical protein